jgi:hypothetical protein
VNQIDSPEKKNEYLKHFEVQSLKRILMQAHRIDLEALLANLHRDV